VLFLLLVQHSALRHGSILALGALFRVGGQKQSFSERRLHEQSGFLTVPLTQLLPLPLNLTLILTLPLPLHLNLTLTLTLTLTLRVPQVSQRKHSAAWQWSCFTRVQCSLFLSWFLNARLLL